MKFYGASFVGISIVSLVTVSLLLSQEKSQNITSVE